MNRIAVIIIYLVGILSSASICAWLLIKLLDTIKINSSLMSLYLIGFLCGVLLIAVLITTALKYFIIDKED